MENFQSIEKLFESINHKTGEIRSNIDSLFNLAEKKIIDFFSDKQLEIQTKKIQFARTQLLERLNNSMLTVIDELRTYGWLKFLEYKPENEDIEDRFLKMSYIKEFDIYKKLKYFDIYTRIVLERIQFPPKYQDIRRYKVFDLKKSRYCLLDYETNELKRLILNSRNTISEVPSKSVKLSPDDELLFNSLHPNGRGVIVILMDRKMSNMTSYMRIYDENLTLRSEISLPGINKIISVDKETLIYYSTYTDEYLYFNMHNSIIESFSDRYLNAFSIPCHSAEANRLVLSQYSDLRVVELNSGLVVNDIKSVTSYKTFSLRVDKYFIYLFEAPWISLFDLDGNLVLRRNVPELERFTVFELVDSNTIYFVCNHKNEIIVI